jgi:hypothetical protein
MPGERVWLALATPQEVAAERNQRIWEWIELSAKNNSVAVMAHYRTVSDQAKIYNRYFGTKDFMSPSFKPPEFTWPDQSFLRQRALRDAYKQMMDNSLYGFSATELKPGGRRVRVDPASIRPSA